MKRLILALAAVAVLAIGTAAAVSAQTPTPSQGQPGWGCWGGGAYGSYDPATNPTLERLADKIGISAADLAQQLKDGKSVLDVAGSKVSEQDLVNLLVAPQTDMLNLRVKYGYLTQDQANAMQKYVADRAKAQLEQKGFAFGWGGGMMGGYAGPGMMGGYAGPGMMGGYGGPGTMGRGFGGPGYGPGYGPRSQGSSF